MNVIVVASRKGGSGKSTLTAHLAAHANKSSRPCLLIDADPQGSLTLWHGLRGNGEPALKSGLRGVSDIVKAAKRDYEWIFVDTPPVMSAVVTDAVRSATLVFGRSAASTPAGGLRPCGPVSEHACGCGVLRMTLEPQCWSKEAKS